MRMRTEITTSTSPDGLHDVLHDLVRAAQDRVAGRSRETSLESLRARITPSDRSLAAALRRPRASFILELKRRSPSRGELRPGASISEVLTAYRGVADAISILTEPTRFGGSLDDLAQARALTDAPLLCKDFVVSPYQVFEARVFGADAILLMMSVLDDAAAQDCLQACRALSMDALVEVHDRVELARALALGAEIIGINNRDLRDLSVDLSVTEQLTAQVPADRIVVSESGVHGRSDLARIADHADAFLVGSALMAAEDLRDASCALTGARVKICGLTRIEDADAAAEAGAALLGAVFADDSPRRCGPDIAQAMAERTELPLVAVFRDQDPGRVIELCQRAGATIAQLHGDYPAEALTRIRSALPGITIWRAHGVPRGAPAPMRAALAGADRILLDTASAGVTGGTGCRFDHRTLAALPDLGETVIAGGLRVEDAGALSSLAPYALDVSSSVETRPGRKAAALMRAFVRATRRSCRSDEDGSIRKSR
jgi:indole-3-glycerol phosphate synthase / phosphoribosylanthranilate isomerase